MPPQIQGAQVSNFIAWTLCATKGLGGALIIAGTFFIDAIKPSASEVFFLGMAAALFIDGCLSDLRVLLLGHK